MQKHEYRCQRCMIVESRWILNNYRCPDYIICRKCGGEIERIGTPSLASPANVKLQALARQIEKR